MVSSHHASNDDDPRNRWTFRFHLGRHQKYYGSSGDDFLSGPTHHCRLSPQHLRDRTQELPATLGVGLYTVFKKTRSSPTMIEFMSMGISPEAIAITDALSSKRRLIANN